MPGAKQCVELRMNARLLYSTPTNFRVISNVEAKLVSITEKVLNIIRFSRKFKAKPWEPHRGMIFHRITRNPVSLSMIHPPTLYMETLYSAVDCFQFEQEHIKRRKLIIQFIIRTQTYVKKI